MGHRQRAFLAGGISGRYTLDPLLFASFDTAKTAEVGTLTYTETDGTFTSTGGKLAFTTQATPSWGDLSVRSQALTLVAGYANVISGIINLSIRNQLIAGWYTSTTITNIPRISVFTASTAIYSSVATILIDPNIPLSASTDYSFVSAWSSINYQQFVKAGGVWRRLWTRPQVDATMYAGVANFDAVGTIDTLKVTPVIETLFAPSISLTGSLSAGTTWVAPSGNFLAQFTLTTRPSAGSVTVFFRVQDANNYWYLDIASTGTSTLYEVVAGVPTSRASGGTAVNGSVITLIADTANIRSFVGTTQSFTYASATNFATSTSAELNSLGTAGVVTGVAVYERYATGNLAAVLDGLV